MKSNRRLVIALGSILIVLTAASLASGHVVVSPRESAAGIEQEYSARVPTERDTSTVRIEITFPEEVQVLELLPKAGWDVEASRNAGGRIVEAVWSGGTIAPGEAEEFAFRALNPETATTLVWNAIQIHEDGSRAEWIGEAGSRNPAPTTVIRD